MTFNQVVRSSTLRKSTRKKTDFLRNLSFLFCSEFFVIQHCGDKHHKARACKGVLKNDKLPQDYLVDHISSSFVETVGWWISGKMKESPEQITQYFLAVIEPILQKPEKG